MEKQMDLLTSGNNAWFKRWFDSSFYHQLYANRDEKEAAGFIDSLLNELQPRKHTQMLDLGCGSGRHATYLASKGFNVTGIDLSASSIRMAKKQENSSLQFYKQDMRDSFGKDRFDYVFNFFTSFGYFNSEEEDHQVIRNISTALKPGATLVMDYINSPYVEQHLVPREEKEIDGIAYHITRWTDDRHFFKRIVIDNIQAEGAFEYTEQVARLRLHDFEFLFTCNGLRLQAVYGDYHLNEYDINTSPRLILVAKKLQ